MVGSKGLVQAALSHDLVTLHEALAQAKPPPLVYRGLPALHVAALNDWAEGVEVLLAAGAQLGTLAVCSCRRRPLCRFQNTHLLPPTPACCRRRHQRLFRRQGICHPAEAGSLPQRLGGTPV